MESPPVTFRRVMLVLLPLLAVGFVFAVMWYAYRDWERSLLGRRRPDVPSDEVPVGGVEMETIAPLGHVVSTDVNFIRKDRHGRTELQFLADVVKHLQKETADIERPCIRFFTDQGEVITLLAERGRVLTKGALTDADDIKSGRLWDNVVLVHDGGSPNDYDDDILVGLEDVTFDNQTQEIATDGPVLMAGGGMTLSASKMRMVLDPQTRRLNTMTFLEDIFITFEAGRRLRVSLTAPAEARGEGETGTTTLAAGPTPPASADAAGAPSDPADADGAGDLWRIDLAGNVHARQDVQRLRCDHLTLYNQSRGAMPAGGGGSPPSAGETGPAAPAGEASSPSSPPPPPGEPSSPQPPAEEGDEAPATPQPLMTVVADGPLIITPVGPDERRSLGDERYRVSATGRPAVVEDGDTRITGHTIRYNTRSGAGTVIGEASPMRLEQPGRLLLTGGRLDFDRSAATAEVTGEGRLQASVRTAGLTGPTPSAAGEGPDASSADAAPSARTEAGNDRLDATWHKGLRLSFYRLPQDTSRGLGEIRRAHFRGQAVVEQAEGRLKGDDLTIDFYPAEGDRGQAVSRLVGRGDVLLKNAPVGGTGADQAARVGDIAAEDLDIRFARDPDGGARPTQLDAAGNVVINDPKGRIRAQDLAVTFGVSDEGETEARFLEARGEVLIDREDLRAEGDHVRRDTAAGTLLLEGRPARARRGESRIVGPHIRFSRPDGRATVTGAGELQVPATTDLRGRPRAEPEPLLVTWRRDMHFSDRRNFARFDGEVTARTGGTDLACRRLWVHFADAPAETETSTAEAEPSTAEGTAPGAGAADTSAEAVEASAETVEADDESATADEGLQSLFGQKRLVRVLAEKDVTAVDQRLEEDRAIRHRMEITGDNLTYLEKSRKAYMHGPGRLRILSRERAGPRAAPSKPLTPKAAADAWRGQAPPGYARTQVAWADSMAFDGLGNQAYFQGDAEAIHTGRGVPGEAGGRRRKPTTTRIRSTDLQVVFGERPGPDESETSREERMRVEKLIARGDVLLWIDERRGSAERLIYQRRPELVRLYRGPEPGEWARLWRQDEATQEFGQIAARTITYDPGTGRVDVVDQQVITLSPEPRPGPAKGPPRLVPGPTD